MFVSLYLSVCWTVVIDIMYFVLFAVCLFVCFYCFLFMSVSLYVMRAFIVLLIKGNLFFLLTCLPHKVIGNNVHGGHDSASG